MMRSYLLSLFVVLFPFALAAESAKESGRVVSITGHWVSQRTHHELSPADTVFSGEEIAPGKKMEDGSLRILYFGRAADRRSTDQLCAPHRQNCPSSLVVPRIGDPDPFMARMLVAIHHLTQTENLQLIFAASRGARGPMESVVSLDKNTPNLAPALHPVAQGEYKVRLTRRTNGSGEKTLPQEGTLLWNNGTANLEIGKELQPGLYEFSILNKHDETIGSPAFILLVPADMYSIYANAYQHLLSGIVDWRKNAETSDMAPYREFCAQALMALDSNHTLAREAHD